MLTTGERMKSRRKELGLSADTVADALGVSRATVFRYERGDIEKLPGQALEPLAKVLCTSVAYLMGWESSPSVQDKSNDFPAPNITGEVVTFRVNSDIAAGYDQPAETLSDWEGASVDIPVSALHGRPAEDYFVIRIKGESMFPHYQDGDYVLVLRTSTLDHSGEVGVLLFGDEGTIKKIEYVPGEDWLRLVPFNPMFPSKTIEGVDLEQCRVIGIPRLLIRDL